MTFLIITCKFCVYLYLVPLLLHSNGSLLAYVVALLVASVSKFSRARGADARTSEFKYPGRKCEFPTIEVLILKAYFCLSFFHVSQLILSFSFLCLQSSTLTLCLSVRLIKLPNSKSKWCEKIMLSFKKKLPALKLD